MSKATTQDRLAAKTPETAFLHVLQQEFNFSPRVSSELLSTAQEMLAGPSSTAVRPGQACPERSRRVRLVVASLKALFGPPLAETEEVEVTLDEQAIRKAALQALLAGEAPDRDGLVAATGFAPEKVEALLDGLIEWGLVVVEPDSGRVVGSWGLSSLPTDHQLRIRGRELYTWCALDAVGIPAGLGEDASIASHCHLCGVPVAVEMLAGQVAQATPPNVRLWVVPDEVGRSVVGFT